MFAYLFALAFLVGGLAQEGRVPAKPHMPALAAVDERAGHCRQRTPLSVRGSRLRRWSYALEGKPWRVIDVTIDNRTRVIFVEDWYVASAVARHGAGQAIVARWDSAGVYQTGYRVLDTTSPMSRAASNRTPLTLAEVDSVRTLAQAVLQRCAQ